MWLYPGSHAAMIHGKKDFLNKQQFLLRSQFCIERGDNFQHLLYIGWLRKNKSK